MCIICAKPAGFKLPDDNVIHNMWSHNSDGAGFMYAKNGKVIIEKGFMKLEDLRKALKRVSDEIDVLNTSMVLHFRITTHGGTKPENTHPFPVSSTMSNLKKLRFTTGLGVAHNGIISSVIAGKDVSDTMEYIVSQLAPLYKGVPNFLDNPHLLNMVENATESKLCFLKPDGSLYTIGKFIDADGIMYSNSSYESFTSVYSRFPSIYGKYDWDSFGYTDYPSHTYSTSDTATSSDEYYGDGWTYEKKTIRPLNAEEGEHIRDLCNHIPDEYEADTDYAVDTEGNVYLYDYTADTFIQQDLLYAYDFSGVLVRAKENDPEAFDDYVLIPDQTEAVEYLAEPEPSNK